MIERRDPKRNLRRFRRLLIVLVVLGIAATVFCIVMKYQAPQSGVQWKSLITFFGIPSALGAAFVLLIRAREES